MSLQNPEQKMSSVSLKRLILSSFIGLSFLCWFAFYFHLKTAYFIPFLSNASHQLGNFLPWAGSTTDRNDNTYVLNSDLCEGNKTKLLILVFSAPQNFISREAIRNTWGLANIDSIS